MTGLRIGTTSDDFASLAGLPLLEQVRDKGWGNAHQTYCMLDLPAPT